MITKLTLAQPQFLNSNYKSKNKNYSNAISFKGRVCNVEKCLANCCYDVPLPRDILRKFADKIVNPVLATKRLDYDKRFGGRNVFPITDLDWRKNKCPFLTITNRCNIYEDRPTICRIFGSSKRKDLTCWRQEVIPDDVK